MLIKRHSLSRTAGMLAAGVGAAAAAVIIVLPALATNRHMAAGAPTVVPSTARELVSIRANSQSGDQFSVWSAQGSDGSSCLMLQEAASGTATYSGNLGGSCRLGIQPSSSPILTDVSWVPDGPQFDVIVRGTLAHDQPVASVDATSGSSSVSFVQAGSAFLGELPSVTTIGELPSGTWVINARSLAGSSIASLNLNALLAAAHGG